LRLNKFLSRCGVASRRAADELIRTGKIIVNKEVVTALGTMIDEHRDVVEVAGKVCKLPVEPIYIALNKPRGFLVTVDDPFGRKTVMQLLKGIRRRIYPVGRLDFDSEGLLLLTDDGELAFRLAHPRFGVSKVYNVKVRGKFPSQELPRFGEGIRLEDGHLARARATLHKQDSSASILSLELTEGRKREIRHMCRILGYPVISLRRIKYDQITLTGLESGSWRHLTPKEVRLLRQRVALT
jgi:23S rRNA pseudouridine2605 synthase/16S rRNA pseudouridine516 synthase